MNIKKMMRLIISDYHNNQKYAKSILLNLTKKYLTEYSIDLSIDDLLIFIDKGEVTKEELCHILKLEDDNIKVLFNKLGYTLNINNEGDLYLILSHGIIGKFDPEVSKEFWNNITSFYKEYLIEGSNYLTKEIELKLDLTSIGIEHSEFGTTIGIRLTKDSEILCIFNRIEKIIIEYNRFEKEYINFINKEYKKNEQ